jgi:hypothetical protein
MRFSDWCTVDQAQTTAPSAAGLFQVKVSAGLLNYPHGKSAMFYYGYAKMISKGLHYYLQQVLPHLETSNELLLVRWMPAEDTEARFQNQLQVFARSFGALPLGNQIWLAKKPPSQQAHPA